MQELFWVKDNVDTPQGVSVGTWLLHSQEDDQAGYVIIQAKA